MNGYQVRKINEINKINKMTSDLITIYLFHSYYFDHNEQSAFLQTFHMLLLMDLSNALDK